MATASANFGKVFDHQRRFIRRFRQAGATDQEHAVTLYAIGERNTDTFRRMVEAGVFLPAQDGGFFIDEPVAAAFLRRAWLRYWMKMAILLLILGALLAPHIWRIYHHKQ